MVLLFMLKYYFMIPCLWLIIQHNSFFPLLIEKDSLGIIDIWTYCPTESKKSVSMLSLL